MPCKLGPPPPIVALFLLQTVLPHDSAIVGTLWPKNYGYGP